MPENEPNQTISKVYGLPVDPALLPLRSDRTIVCREGCSIPYEFKRSEDLLDYVVDMMKWLEAGEDIVSVLGWTDSDSLRITNIQFSATAVLAYVIGGEDDACQTVSLSIATSLGKVKLVQFAVHTKSNVRPVTGLYVGRMHMDTAINPNGRPIWWNGAAWVDAGGAVV